MNSNIPRHAIWRPGMTWDKVGELDADTSTCSDRGRVECRRRGCATWMRWASIRRCSIRPGSPRASTWSRIPTSAYALARAYNDWIADFCKAAPDRLFAASMVPLQNMDYAVEEFRRIAKNPCFRAALHPADVSRRPILHASDLRSAMGGTREAGYDLRGASSGGAVESGVDLARSVFRKDKDPAAPSFFHDRGRRRTCRWWWIGYSASGSPRRHRSDIRSRRSLRRGSTIICSSRRR